MSRTGMVGLAGAVLGICAVSVLGFAVQGQDSATKLDELKAMTVVGNHKAAFRHDLSEDCDLGVTGGKINLIDSRCAARESWLETQEFIVSETKRVESGMNPSELTIKIFLDEHARHIQGTQADEFRKISKVHARLLDEAKKKFEPKK